MQSPRLLTLALAILIAGCEDNVECDHDLVASIGPTSIRQHHVDAVRAQIQPPPTIAQASRLAVLATQMSIASGHEDWIFRTVLSPAAQMDRRLALYREQVRRGDNRQPEPLPPVSWNGCVRGYPNGAQP